MTVEQAYKIALPLLQHGVVCVLSNEATFLVRDEVELDRVKSWAESQKLECHVINPVKEKVVEVKEETTEPVKKTKKQK